MRVADVAIGHGLGGGGISVAKLSDGLYRTVGTIELVRIAVERAGRVERRYRGSAQVGQRYWSERFAFVLDRQQLSRRCVLFVGEVRGRDLAQRDRLQGGRRRSSHYCIGRFGNEVCCNRDHGRNRCTGGGRFQLLELLLKLLLL